MCCRFTVIDEGDEGRSRIFIADYEGQGRGHEVDPLKFMRALKMAVGYANTLIREGRKGVYIWQLPDPCRPHTVLPPFDLDGFCLAPMKQAMEETKC